MPGFHTPSKEAFPCQTSEQTAARLKRRAITPIPSRPGTPEASDRDIAYYFNLSRPATPLSIRSRTSKALSPRVNGDTSTVRDLKQWCLIWDSAREEFVAVPCADLPHAAKDGVPEDVGVPDEFTFILEESTPMFESFDDSESVRQALKSETSSLKDKDGDPNSSFLEFEES